MAIPRVQWNDNPTTLHTITAAIDQAGCCVVEDAIQNETAQAIRRELVAFDSAGSIGASAFEGHATRRTGAPLPPLRDLPLDRNAPGGDVRREPRARTNDWMEILCIRVHPDRAR